MRGNDLMETPVVVKKLHNNGKIDRDWCAAN
jgi:hypothetical protein